MPHRSVPPAYRRLATAMRSAMRSAMTPAELRLWRALRKPGIEGVRFRRQAPVGPYIVDFFCPAQRLIIEVDGDQHGFDDGRERDGERDQWLASNDYRILRFWNHEVLTGPVDGSLPDHPGGLRPGPPPEIR